MIFRKELGNKMREGFGIAINAQEFEALKQKALAA